jgi:hypothetical protein
MQSNQIHPVSVYPESRVSALNDPAADFDNIVFHVDVWVWAAANISNISSVFIFFFFCWLSSVSTCYVTSICSV